jgi:formyl-CoA transferase
VRRDETLGEVRQVGSPVTFADGWVGPASLAEVDRLGGHTRDILRESGYADAEIDDLIARKIVA